MQDQNFQPMPWSIKYITGILVAVELLLSASDIGIIPGENLRARAFAYGALWPELWRGDWQSVFPAQQFLMFLSYAFLHGGFLHMAMNTVIIAALGKRLATALTGTQLVLLFAGSAIAGGVVFEILSTEATPMVGASGAVFGFFGIWKYLEYAARKRMRLSQKPVLQFIGVLVILNVALMFMLSGMLAWQAHLGGFVGGWIMGVFVARKAGQTGGGAHR